MQSILTVDLGGTQTSYAAVRSTAVTVLERHEVPQSVDCFMEQLHVLVKEIECDGISVAIPGVISSHREIQQTPNVGWLNNVLLADRLENQFKRPVWLTNDMEALAVAELKYGALQEARCGIVQTVSTGIGGCTCLRVREAELVIPGEPGHVMFSPDGPRCGCGRYGCVEALFSGGAVRQLVLEHVGDLIPTGVDPCAYLDVAAGERAAWALEIYKEVGTGLGIAWANALNQTSWIEKIVYAGSFAVHGMRFMRHHIEQTIAQRVMTPHHRTIPIEQSGLWPNGAHLGAAIVFEQCETSRSTDERCAIENMSRCAEATEEFTAAL